MIPPELRALPEPPSEFVACAVPEHTGHNFLSHPHFSSKQNKTYWLLLGPLNEGVYTLKSVSAPFGEGRRTDQHIEQIACARKGEWGWRHRRRFLSQLLPNGRMSSRSGKNSASIGTGSAAAIRWPVSAAAQHMSGR